MTKKEWFWLIVLVIVGTSFCSISLWQTKYAPGWDSYFYMDQVKHWFENGELHSSRINIIYPLLISLQYFCSDYVLSYKILTILAYASCAPVIFFIGKSLKLTPEHAGVVAFLFIANPISLYFACQFTKNTLGTLFLLLFILSLVRKQKISTLLWLVALVFTHKLTLVIAILIGLLSVLFTIINRTWVRLALPFFLLLMAFIGFYWLAPHQLDSIHYPLWAFHQSHDSFLNSLTFYWGYGMTILLIYEFIQLRYHTSPIYTALVSVCLFLLMPFLKWDTTGYGYRFLLMFLFLSPLLLLKVTMHDGVIKKLLLPLTLLLLFLGNGAYNPTKQDPPYKEYTFISNSIQHINSHLIITHKGLAEFISFQTGKDVLPWSIYPEEVSQQTYRLAYIPHAIKRKVEHHLNSKFKKITSRYYLMKEALWSTLITQLDYETNSQLLTWRNPHEVRNSAIIK